MSLKWEVILTDAFLAAFVPFVLKMLWDLKGQVAKLEERSRYATYYSEEEE